MRHPEHLTKAFELLSSIHQEDPLGTLIAKKALVAELWDHHLLPTDLLRQYHAAYVGSNTDVALALAFGMRKGLLVDYIFKAPIVQAYVGQIIEVIIGKKPSLEGNTFRFDFDFGDGLEQTEISCLKRRWQPAVVTPRIRKIVDPGSIKTYERNIVMQEQEYGDVPYFTADNPLSALLFYSAGTARAENHPDAVDSLVGNGLIFNNTTADCCRVVSSIEGPTRLADYVDNIARQYRNEGTFEFIKLNRQKYRYSFLRKCSTQP